jgi:N-acetyl-gamma-glutamyl-phosphate reductase
VDAGIIPAGTPLTVNAISGYSGGGKPLMELYEGGDDHEPWGAYGFNLVGDDPVFESEKKYYS